MSKMSRNKGKRGERQVIDWLQPIVDEICADLGIKQVLLQRNTVQSDVGGSDICGLNWLAAEVKNCEAQGPKALQDWWNQCVEQAATWSTPGNFLTPVLFYTKNHSPIRVRMNGWAGGTLISAVGIPCLVDISAEDFEVYFKARCRAELASA